MSSRLVQKKLLIELVRLSFQILFIVNLIFPIIKKKVYCSRAIISWTISSLEQTDGYSNGNYGRICVLRKRSAGRQTEWRPQSSAGITAHRCDLRLFVVVQQRNHEEYDILVFVRWYGKSAEIENIKHPC